MSSSLQRVALIGEERDKELLRDFAHYTYLERAEGPVQAHILFPPGPHGDHRPLVVFFHGGFWDVSAISQFVPHCLHFASRGAVAVVAQTRTNHRHGTGAVEVFEDARELIRWLRFNHDTFGIDPGKVIVGGAGGGATAALLAGMPKPKDLVADDGISSMPQAMLLFSSMVDPSRHKQAMERFPQQRVSKDWNPMKLIRTKLPPMMLFHGKADRVAPFADVERFRRKVRFWRNRCELIPFERAEHSFFNFNVNSEHYERTLYAADRFVTDLGLLSPADEVISTS